MIIETAVIEALRALAVPVYYGTAPQPEGDQPVPLPVVIVNRVASGWLSDLCGTDPGMSVVTVQADYYAETAQQAREMADQGRGLIAGLVQPDSRKVGGVLDNEISARDDVSRSWRVIQQWTIPDYSPNA